MSAAFVHHVLGLDCGCRKRRQLPSGVGVRVCGQVVRLNMVVLVPARGCALLRELTARQSGPRLLCADNVTRGRAAIGQKDQRDRGQ